jgi:hypothetical protein
VRRKKFTPVEEEPNKFTRFVAEVDQGEEIPFTPVQLATRALLRRAYEARTDIARFYEFVIKHETTKAPLKPAPHQKLMFKFVLDNPMCVVRQPVGTGKTFGMTAIGLWLTGQDVTQRGAIISKAQGQSAKVLRMVSDYITDPNLNSSLSLVYPWLKRTTRSSEPWSQTAITVDRPAGIRDPTLIAVGLDGQIQGSRLSWVLGDDILDADNTSSELMRDQTNTRFDSRALSRLDPTGSRCVVTNTPWSLDDLTYRLERTGWPTLSMDIVGNIWFSNNVPEEWILATGLLRRSTVKADCWRLTEHDPDPEELTPLWPERYTAETIAKIKAMRLPHEFSRLFMCRPFNEEAMRCQKEWIDRAKMEGRGKLLELGKVDTSLPTYTGVDIGIGQGSVHDLTSMFTFQLMPDGRRKVVDIETGRWSGPTIAAKVIEKHDRFHSVVAVESNTAQDFIRQFVLAKRPSLRVRPHTTSKVTKYNLDFGIESMFTEFQNGMWIVPCDNKLQSTSEIERWLDECLTYQPPPEHTGDRLMASWIARECSRRGGGGRDPRPSAGSGIQTWRGGSF